jgi:hypothetical protein
MWRGDGLHRRVVRAELMIAVLRKAVSQATCDFINYLSYDASRATALGLVEQASCSLPQYFDVGDPLLLLFVLPQSFVVQPGVVLDLFPDLRGCHEEALAGCRDDVVEGLEHHLGGEREGDGARRCGWVVLVSEKRLGERKLCGLKRKKAEETRGYRSQTSETDRGNI